MNLIKCVHSQQLSPRFTQFTWRYLQQNLFSVGVKQWLSTGSVNLTQVAEELNPEWCQVINNAEKILGCPTSYFNLNSLQRIKSVNEALRDLETSNHPFLNIAKSLIYNEKNIIQTWGLVVLLISKAAGHPLHTLEMDIDKEIGVLQNQRTLAELTEKIRLGFGIHRSMVNLLNASEENKTMLNGNKLSILSGDYLLAHCYAGLASLRNHEILELIGVALRDQSEAEFIGPRDNQNFPLPAKPKNVQKIATENLAIKEIDNVGFTIDKTEILLSDNFSIYPINISEALGHAKAEWTIRHTLSGGSLLGKSCQGTLNLARQTPEIQEQGYLFGINFALAMQASLDFETFPKFSNGKKPFSLISAPVLFQLEHDPSLYEEIEKGTENILDVDYELIHNAVFSGPGLEKTRQLQKEHSQKALESLRLLPPSVSRNALNDIVCAL